MTEVWTDSFIYWYLFKFISPGTLFQFIACVYSFLSFRVL